MGPLDDGISSKWVVPILQSILQLREYKHTAKSYFQVFLKNYIEYIYK